MTQADKGEPRSEIGSQCAIADLLGEQILRVGDEGPLVRAVQLALARLGYPLRGSGSFADKTLSAVKDFQKAHGLEVDGEIGEETAKAIDRALAERSSTTAASASTIAGLIGDRILRVGDAGPIVQAVQLGLARLGYPLKGTGNLRPGDRAGSTGFPDASRPRGRRRGGTGNRHRNRPCARRAHAPRRALASGRSQARCSGERARLAERPQPAQPAATGSAGGTGWRQLFSAWAIRDQRCRHFSARSRSSATRSKGTGYFGGATEAAVTDFQEQRGLEVDGEVGAETARAIDQAVAGAAAVRRSARRASSRLSRHPGPTRGLSG